MLRDYKGLSELYDIVEGKSKATLVIKGGKILNVYTEEIIENADIAIYGNKVVKVGDCSGLIGKETKVLNVKEKFIVPGFIDSFLILEFSMQTPATYARYALSGGVTTIVLFPAPLYRLFRKEGIRFFEEELSNTPVRFYYMVPLITDEKLSTIVPDHETFVEFLLNKKVLGVLGFSKSLSELDFKNVINQYISDSILSEKPIGGFAPPDEKAIDVFSSLGLRFFTYIRSEKSAMKVLRNGGYLVLSLLDHWKLKEITETITKNKISTDGIVLSTGLLDMRELSRGKHLSNLLSYIVELGIDPVEAIRFLTVNPARMLGIENKIGSIAPGKLADVVVLKDLTKFEVYATIVDGNIVFSDNEFHISSKIISYPKYLTETISYLRGLNSELLQVNTSSGNNVKVRAIKVNNENIDTEEEITLLSVVNGKVMCNITDDILYLSLVDRKGEYVQNAFIKGIGLKRGAIALTLNLGSNEIITVGTNTKDMLEAIRTLTKINGGISVVENGRNLFSLPLPLAGFMSFEVTKQLSFEIEVLYKNLSKIGCKNEKILLVISALSDVNIPRIRITRNGLFDVESGKFVETVIL
ncbi:MAG: adenine deaminase C-terminal domain-containing protein [Thermoproteota archaeon]